jgi:osmotically-inducible protein OsmY
MKTDAQLRLEVIEALNSEPALNAALIRAESVDGAVTLAGQVGSLAEKWYAERAVRRVPGVRAVTVQIAVQLLQSGHRHDDEIARTANQVLRWTTSLPKDSVDVAVEDGWLTLTGEVCWEHERRAAVAAVRLLAGLRGLTDLISVRDRVSRAAVMDGVYAALRRLAAGNVPKIMVEVHGAQVTLSGEVHSWAERASARRSAWGTPGVYSVVDRMTLLA